ncbi:TonB-dependent receptor domain-containing protein [uncultured Sphingomonas sp.]|uniref:TonB-dependent receptor domain-containing protein n=1 Tax=uncultured Sphingomonas sp. TaxID=158754 RepID=UPI0035C96B09
MTKMTINPRKAALLFGAAPFAMLTAMTATPAFAQDATAQPNPAAQATPTDAVPSPANSDKTAAGNDIVVTGTLFRNQSETNIASPVSVLTTGDLNARGIQTVQQAIQTLASNNGPALTNSFSANGAFAGGASGASLRGLTTNSTLVLFDGLRAAYYPLADDGSRNFVDLNTIPDEIVDRVEVLRDGASSSYGADAIAGVINIITKKQVIGVSGTAEAGVSQRGDAANQRLSLTAGMGDLSTQNFNVYISGHYVHSDALYSRDRGYPYNTDNQLGLCANAPVANACTDNRQNSPLNYAGVSTIVPVFLVRPATAATGTAVAGSRYQFLNSVTGCNGLTPYNPTTAELAAIPNSPTTVCTQDTVNQGGVIEPRLTRVGGSMRASVNIGTNTHAYAEFNFEQSTVGYSGYGLAGYGLPTNSVIRASAPAGIDFLPYSTSSGGLTHAPGSGALALPVFICPRGTTVACTAANGTLNPNNPFASQGQTALLLGTLPDLTQFTETRSRAYRLAGGIDGSFGQGWDWRVNAVGMVNDLRQRFDGRVYIQHLLDEVADGSYNFINPSQNSQATLDYLSPTLVTNDQSQEYQADANLSHSLFELPGGPLMVAVGGSYRYESVNSPSANPDYNGPTQRYFGINAFGTVGHRSVESGYFQINAPILSVVNLEGSGRYDHYSSGQSHFSPKGGIVFNPIRQLTLRGTISGGFRIPSFGETSSLPTTGYVPYGITNFPAAYLAQFSTNPAKPCVAGTPANCSTYVSQATIGETSVANPNLKPETSRNITGGFEIRPFRGLTLTADYYNIRKNNAIAAASYSTAINAYYAGQAIPAGYAIVPNAPDVNHPNAMPTIFTVSAPYINANTIQTDGFDFGATLNKELFAGIKFTSIAEAEFIRKLETTFPDGHTERYDGTIGNYNLTAGTGTPKWKVTWQNTLDFGAASLSATGYYTAGYNLSAADQGVTRCTDPTGGTDPNNPTNGLDGGIQGCNVRRFIDVDLTGTIKVNDKFSFYVNVFNVFDAKAPLDTVTYGGYLYNPVVAESGIIGRSFRAGVRASF